MISKAFFDRGTLLVFSLFFISSFLIKDVSNISIIILVLISLYYLSNIGLHDTCFPINQIILFTFIIVSLSVFHESPIHEIDHYMRLIFLVPIYFCFKEIQISEKFLSNLFIIGGIFTISFYLYQSYNLSIGERYSGSSTTAITYANLLMTLIIFLLSSYLRNNSYSKKALIFSIIIMLFYVCFQTGSKGAIIGLIFSLFIFLIIYKQKILSLILPIIFSLPLVFVSPLADKFGTMYHSLLNIDINNIANSTVENASENERIYYYKFSIQKITNNPLLGIGPNNFESMLKNDLKKNNLNIRAADHAHNDFLDLSVKFGFVALVVFLYILYYFAKPALLYKKLWFSELALLNIFSQLGYMMTQSQFAHQQSIVFFTVLLYIFHSQIKKTNPS